MLIIFIDKCVNPENKRPYPTSIIIKAMRDIPFSSNINKSAKLLVNANFTNFNCGILDFLILDSLHFKALETIPKLNDVIPLERAQMRIKVSISGKEANKFRE